MLANCFKRVTANEFKPDEFVFEETKSGKSVMVWKKKHEGKIIYSYLEARNIGCGTEMIPEAVKKDLIPK